MSDTLEESQGELQTKMRVPLLVLFCVVCTLAKPAAEDEYPVRQHKIADKAFLQRVKDVFRLFRYINQPSYYQDFVEAANNYKVENNADAFSNKQAYQEFVHYYQQGFLPRGEVFSIFYKEHVKEAAVLFKAFYYAKSYDDLYKFAVWARQNINEGLFLYSFSVALKHRNDTYSIILPPIYEVYPYYFVNSEVIYTAQRYKQLYNGHDKAVYTIPANYSGWYVNADPEQSLSYFLEDVGLNSFYYYYNLYYPYWLGGEEFNLKKDRRGELYYYLHQQLLARYYLERLSNNQGKIPLFDYNYPIETGYYPSLHYPNGQAFPSRPANVHLQNNYYYYEQNNPLDVNRYSFYIVQDLERRIRDAIDAGFVYTENGQHVNLYSTEGIEVLGNLIEGNKDSPNNRLYGYLEYFARWLLGYTQNPLNKYQIVPSALQHYETSLRDPIFWQFYKHVVLYFQKYKLHLPKYNQSDLYFPGVSVENVQVDRLVTYFDYFDWDISSSVYVNAQEFESNSFQVNARQKRLNHKPFSYTIDVQSNKQQQAVVRVYLGPKYDEYGRPIDINENRMNFIEIDSFSYELKNGKNSIVRNPYQFSFSGPDRTSYQQLYQEIENALKGGEEFQADVSEYSFGYPQRLLLPKGQHGGQPFQFYVIVSPFRGHVSSENMAQGGILKPGSGNIYIDNLPYGYPFDREVDESVFFSVPNSYFKDVVIYHRSGSEINVAPEEYAEEQA